MVPFNLKDLADLMGGPEVAATRLDAFFTKLNAGDKGPDSWMSWVGNEPNLNAPWIYDFLGQPWKTQATVRRAMTELYSANDAAYPGNDDVGEMSSWYVFGALGMYPELPGSDILVLRQPAVSQGGHAPAGRRRHHHRQRRGRGCALRPGPDGEWPGLEQTVDSLLRHFRRRHAGLLARPRGEYELGQQPCRRTTVISLTLERRAPPRLAGNRALQATT